MSELASILSHVDAENGILIGGQWQEGNRPAFDVENPAVRSVISRVADGDAAQARAAADAAAAAAADWRRTSPRERSDLLHRAYELMSQEVDAYVALICAENGKVEADARAEVRYAAEFFRWYAEEAVRPGGDYGPAPAGGVRAIVTHRPVGVAALITPWNFPAAMVTRKLGPALAAGCTVVLKPAAETPLTAIAIVRALETAGVPAGVINLVPTSDPAEIVGAWMDAPVVRKVSFTGSTRIGQHLLRQAADRVIKASMELGGNAPFVVAPDADIDAALDGAMMAKFRGGGQACTAANRFYVHESVTREFTSKLADRVHRLRVGPASEISSEIGPLISARAVENTTRLVDDAVARGSRVVARAEVPPAASGYFFAPTLLADVPHDAAVVQQEIFAPVAPVVTWADEDELLDMVNGTEMGLASYIYSTDLKWAMQLGEQIEAGMVAINRGLVSDPSAPFGGVNQSGLGREGAREGLTDYQETQYLSIDWSTR